MRSEAIKAIHHKQCTALTFWILLGIMDLNTFAEEDSLKNASLFERTTIEGVIEIGLSYGERGYVFFNGKNDVWESDYERHLAVEADFEIEITNKIKAEFDIEGEYSSPGPKLQKGLLQFDLPGKQVLRLGNMKRRLGLEERAGRSERLVPNRSILHSYFSTFGFMGLDFAVEYQKKWKLQSGNTAEAWGQFGGDGDLRFFSEASAGLKMKHLRTGLGLLYMEHLQENRKNCYIGTVTAVWDKRGSEILIEIHTGKDPLASYYSSFFSNGPDIHFFGSRFQISHLFTIKNSVIGDLQPALSIAHVAPDVDLFQEGVMEFYPALNIYIGPSKRVRWITGISAICTVNEPRDGAIHLREHRITSSFQALF